MSAFYNIAELTPENASAKTRLFAERINAFFEGCAEKASVSFILDRRGNIIGMDIGGFAHPGLSQGEISLLKQLNELAGRGSEMSGSISYDKAEVARIGQNLGAIGRAPGR